jgi:glycosyltransferase involved in cell wall biosynthesis
VCRELGVPHGSRLIATGGRSEAGFGPKDAIVAFDMLRYDTKDLYLVVCGAGPDAPALEQFGRSLAFDDFRVRFVPCGPARAAAVGSAEAVFVTSPRGGVDDALEAMAAGKPVLGWQSPDLAEIVADKSTGVLVPVGDRAALAACARPVLENPATARRLGEAGRARAAERFGAARVVEQFARLYQELTGFGRSEDKG